MKDILESSTGRIFSVKGILKENSLFELIGNAITDKPTCLIAQ